MNNKEFIDLFLKKSKTIKKEDFYYVKKTHEEIESEIGEVGIELLIKEFYKKKYDLEKMKETLSKLNSKLNLNDYTLNYFIYVYAFRDLKEIFSKKYSEKLFWETIDDINLKAMLCKSYKKCWGIFTIEWYIKFFQCKIVRLGRLQFEETIASDFIKEEMNFNGYKIYLDKKVYSVHIPELGPLSKKEVEDAYSLASECFGKNTILFCKSWLLYKDNKKIINGKSNIKEFMDGWFIFKNIEDKNFEFAWRIFNEDYKGNVELLSKETRLQRDIIEWLNKGLFLGIGIGIKSL